MLNHIDALLINTTYCTENKSEDNNTSTVCDMSFQNNHFAITFSFVRSFYSLSFSFRKSIKKYTKNENRAVESESGVGVGSPGIF